MTVLLSASAFADGTSLGTSLSLKTDTSGTPSFGAAYTYGDDPDGSNYLLSLSANSTSPQMYRWNFYLASTGSYLLDWSSAHSTSLAVIQVKISDASLVSKLLVGQKKLNGKPELYFVLADENNTPVYNVSISELCASNPENFKNLTDNKGCDQF